MPHASASPLEAHLGYWLRFVSNHVSQAFAQKTESQGVSVAEWVVLRELYDASQLPSVLAARLGMTRGAITKIVDRLEARRLLARTASADDRRSHTLSLTRSGRALVPRLAALADRNDEEFFGHLDARRRQELTDVLRGIVARKALTSVPTA